MVQWDASSRVRRRGEPFRLPAFDVEGISQARQVYDVGVRMLGKPRTMNGPVTPGRRVPDRPHGRRIGRCPPVDRQGRLVRVTDQGIMGPISRKRPARPLRQSPGHADRPRGSRRRGRPNLFPAPASDMQSAQPPLRRRSGLKKEHGGCDGPPDELAGRHE